MTATEELRRLLDERGVEWGNVDSLGNTSDDLTEWQLDGMTRATAHEWVNEGLFVSIYLRGRTPEQAVEATLGRGTCCITDSGPWGYPCVCSECGASFDPDVNGGEFNYCPNCGRKVVQP